MNMSLNWTQIDHSSLRPIPLPNEILLESFSGIDLELRLPVSLMGPKRTTRSSGQIHLSNQRVIFVSSTAGLSPPDAPPPSTSSASDTLGSSSSPVVKQPSTDAVGLPIFLKSGVEYVSSFLSIRQPSDTSAADPQISTISIPLAQLLDRKFNQNLFDSNTVYISFRPTSDGGFPSSRQGVESIEITLAFKEGRVWELWKALETCLKRAYADELERRRQRQHGESLPAYPGSI
ncbi:hypothetical protein [Phaffia rhodozyma]|uniref:Uncharacterized protein n=1 Tax=Phaffia rhodozyma TaxID=264483 RepID=A0A0F7SMY4_PHARH|nr:hypothetical protein [Phaffia rhodozyma]